jgi:hypothetical protein
LGELNRPFQTYLDLDLRALQAMRGAGGSFGITVSIQVMTFPAPPSATVFQYIWNLNVRDAANGLLAFQNFSQTPNLSPQFGAEISLRQGSAGDDLYFKLVGGWYGPADELDATLQPLLAMLPPNPQTTLTPGPYIHSVQFLGAPRSLNTSSAPDVHDTFYAKSLMTPQSSPMSLAAITAFMQYLVNQGPSSQTVRHSRAYVSGR